MKNVNKETFISMLMKNGNVSKAEATAQYNNFIKTLDEALLTGKTVLIGDICRMKATMRKGGKGINPQTGDIVDRKDCPRIKCTVSSMFAPKIEAAVATGDK
jgi:nucleoid DNA-binding protein|nr:MAG TPA_asm: Bacterial DNA-binding protein [Caudoviricetes sp.]